MTRSFGTGAVGRWVRGHKGIVVNSMLLIGLGLGFHMATFSVTYAVLLQALPVSDPETLYILSEVSKDPQHRELQSSVPTLEEWRRRSRCFSGVAGAGVFLATTKVGGRPEVTKSAFVSPDFFEVLGVRPVMGRGLSNAGALGTDAVVSEALWRKAFGSEELGTESRSLRVGQQDFHVVGVAPPHFRTPGGTDLWLPLTASKQLFPNLPTLLTDRKQDMVRLFVRRSDRCSDSQVQRDVARVATHLSTDFPESHAMRTAALIPWRERAVGHVKREVWLLETGAIATLLIVIVNFTILLLARMADRERRFVLCAALGASPLQVARAAAAECLGLALLGGVAGLISGVYLTSLLRTLLPADFPFVRNIGLNWVVVAVSVGIWGLLALACSLIPAVRVARLSPARILAQDPSRMAGPGRTRRHWGLAVAELSVAVALSLFAAVVLVRYQELRRIDPGFAPDGTLVLSVSLAGDQYNDSQTLGKFFTRAINEVRGIPGVLAVSVASDAPLEGYSCSAVVEPDLREIPCQAVGADYARALGARLIAGRDIQDSDVQGRTAGILVSRHFAATTWGSENPIGKIVRLNDGRTKEVVGVVAEIAHDGLTAPPSGTLYLPELMNNMSFLVRAHPGTRELEKQVEEAVWRVDQEQPFYRATTLAKLLDDSSAPERLSAGLVGFLAALALAVAMTGLLGMLSYFVVREQRSFAIRIVLGAPRSTILRYLLGSVLSIAAAGTVGGSLAFWWGSSWLSDAVPSVATLGLPGYCATIVLVLSIALGGAVFAVRRPLYSSVSEILRSGQE